MVSERVSIEESTQHDSLSPHLGALLLDVHLFCNVELPGPEEVYRGVRSPPGLVVGSRQTFRTGLLCPRVLREVAAKSEE